MLSFLRQRSISRLTLGGAGLQWVRENSFSSSLVERSVEESSPGGASDLSPALQRWGKWKREFKSRRACPERSRRDRVLTLLRDARGSALLEFAIVLPLLVVFVVGIYDFGGAYNQKQKIEQAAQEGAIVAGAQPMSDIASPTPPDSLLPVVTAVFNSLVGSGVVPSGTCVPPGTAKLVTGVEWKYTISGCPDDLFITINRGLVSAAGSPRAVGTRVKVTYPYHWRLFGSVIQLLFPGPNGYSAPTPVTGSATVHNQM